MISVAQEESKRAQDSAQMVKDSPLGMERKFFNYKKELKQLFAKSMAQYGGSLEEEKEEGKGREAEDMYEGASKKMKRRMRMMQKL